MFISDRVRSKPQSIKWAERSITLGTGPFHQEAGRKMQVGVCLFILLCLVGGLGWFIYLF